MVKLIKKNHFISLKTLTIIFLLIIAFLLRFYKISSIPPGLYIDEVSIGYNAYLISSKGVDEYNVKYPLWFKAFGEYKLPVYIYLTSASISLFGKNDLAIRLPSVIFGSLSVIVLFLLLLRIGSYSLAFFSAILLAFSPWHLQFSRAAFEANVALFFYLLGFYLFILFITKKTFVFLILSTIFFVTTLYTYNSYRLVTPLTIIISFSFVFIKYPKQLKNLFFAGFLFCLLSFPFFQFALSEKGNSRFITTSTFSKYRNDPYFKKIVNYPVFFSYNYLSYFSFNYLFVNGDGMGRHRINGFGIIPYWQLPFLLIGFVYILKEKNSLLKYLVLILLILSPLPGAFSNPSPHALRSLSMVIPLIIIVVFGMIKIFENKKNLKYIFILIFPIIIFETMLYFHYYYAHYQKNQSMDWGGEYKETINKITIYSKKNKKIYISNSLMNNKIYIQFYNNDLSVNFTNMFSEKPKENQFPVLYITENIGNLPKKINGKLIDNVRLENPNKDVFAQFWEL